MISAKLISQDATLNNFQEQATISYVPGENLTINFRLFNRDSGLRYIPETATPIVAATVLDIDNNEITKTCSEINALDKSLYSFSLSQAETEHLSGGNIMIKLDLNGDGTVIYMAVLQSVLLRQLISGDCC